MRYDIKEKLTLLGIVAALILWGLALVLLHDSIKPL